MELVINKLMLFISITSHVQFILSKVSFTVEIL